MTRNRIAGAISALALLAAPAVAAAHGGADDHGRHHGRHHHKHHAKKTHTREVTGTATATIASFAAGELTLALPSGKTYTADVTDRTVIVCHSAPAPATAASHGGDDNSGKGDDDGANHDAGDDHGDHNAPSTTAPASTTVPPSTTPTPSGDDRRCGTDALVTGAKVSAAKLSLNGDSVIWKKLAVVK
jgi:hypothetical protein